MKTFVFALLLLALGMGGFAYYSHNVAADRAASFRTATVARGDLRSTIGATGIVQPEDVIDVGAQVAGRIVSLGADPRGETDSEFEGKTVDYGSPVRKDLVLAEIDKLVYSAEHYQANASHERAKADLHQMQAKLEQAKRDWKRAQGLREIGGNIKGIADSDYDLAKANYEVAEANVEVGKAVIQQAEGALRLAQSNLDYSTIKSPVDGVIIDRRVNIGQTVVASLNAPSLFLIAKDLSKVQVWASVNEADIGQIISREKMPVRFTVDAYPKDTFRGYVAQVRLNANMTQNVVTYTVVVACDNSDRKLLPYLTANAVFEVETRENVLTVPNPALRWRPRPEQLSPELREKFFPAGTEGRPGVGQGGAATAGNSGGPAKPSKSREEGNRVWVLDDDKTLRPVSVEVGVTDGVSTEITSDELTEGTTIVIGENRQEVAGNDTTNPFAPPLRPGRGGAGGGAGGGGQRRQQ